MKTVSSMLDPEWHERYLTSTYTAQFMMRQTDAIYNARDAFFSSNEHKVASEETDIKKWELFIEKKKDVALILPFS